MDDHKKYDELSYSEVVKFWQSVKEGSDKVDREKDARIEALEREVRELKERVAALSGQGKLFDM
jgi:uncharacterized protein YceH (UPF0502 family)